MMRRSISEKIAQAWCHKFWVRKPPKAGNRSKGPNFISL